MSSKLTTRTQRKQSKQNPTVRRCQSIHGRRACTSLTVWFFHPLVFLLSSGFNSLIRHNINDRNHYQSRQSRGVTKDPLELAVLAPVAANNPRRHAERYSPNHQGNGKAITADAMLQMRGVVMPFAR